MIVKPPKYLKRNHASVMPNRYVFLDTEANRHETAWGERQQFRLGVLRFDRRRSKVEGWGNPRYETVAATDVLWKAVDRFTGANVRTVLVAHNLGYDILLSNAFAELPTLDWHVVSCNIQTSRAWMVWKKGTRTLVLTDLMSWVKTSLETIGKWIGIPKLPLPAWEDDNEAWEKRCHQDVKILGEAWHQLMEWVEDNDCGMWRPTGAGMSWSKYRHSFYDGGIQHHGQDELYDMERRASWTGRCEAWKHGKLSGGPFTEWDMTLAYATIAKEIAVPIAPQGHINTPSIATIVELSKRASVLATCTVTTDVPTVPTLMNDRIVWPVGTFQTTLWSPEILLALENGATIEPLQATVYRSEPVLKKWGDWICSLLQGESDVLSPLVQAMLKHWARSVIGRFGLKYSVWQNWGQIPFQGITAFSLYEHNETRYKRCISIGTESLIEIGQEESPDSCPSIMGYIMSECRARLWRTMQTVGLERVVYVDTDSLWTGDLSSDARSFLMRQGWRPKQSWERVEILGPRQIIVHGEIKASGVPYRARKTEGKNWEGEVWSSPMAQLQSGNIASVDVIQRRGVIGAPDKRRSHLENGETESLVIDL